ncbi:AAA family ATPase [Acidianus sp. HS-5]|uniref:AAA family ATPase n=1 Tax=Acidianus sp. HS-5 TaxID=2886040 RepID=UPI001F1D9700|nr:AAA family ATPase [Acidianus sp. HS-5]BDC19004.1 AAA family ATPase [Acidianus sp. HS-5]
MEYKHCKLSEFVFKNGNLISFYGTAGSGKTAVALQILEEITPSIYISTQGKSYEARVDRMSFVSKNTFFVEANSADEVIENIIKSIELQPELIVVDSINTFYRLNRKTIDLIQPLIFLKEFSKYKRIIITWQMSMNNKVSGEKFMRYFSDDVIRVTKNYLIGNLRECKFKITDKGVIGCLKNY